MAKYLCDLIIYFFKRSGEKVSAQTQNYISILSFIHNSQALYRALVTLELNELNELVVELAPALLSSSPLTN